MGVAGLPAQAWIGEQIDVLHARRDPSLVAKEPLLADEQAPPTGTRTGGLRGRYLARQLRTISFVSWVPPAKE